MMDMGAVLPAGYVTADVYWRPRVLFAPFSRIPKSVLTPERLADLVRGGQAALDDAGQPGPSYEAVEQCWQSTLGLNQRGDDVVFKKALRAIYDAARGE
jgi:hypothetical protein